MMKAFKMEENMLESNVDLEVILGKVQREIPSLSMNPQCVLVS